MKRQEAAEEAAKATRGTWGAGKPAAATTTTEGPAKGKGKRGDAEKGEKPQAGEKAEKADKGEKPAKGEKKAKADEGEKKGKKK
jgi:hypothetical protein